MGDTPTDDQVLAHPEDFSVDQVTAVFDRVTDDEVAGAQTLEDATKKRATILNWERPEPQPDPDEPRFSRERALSGEILPGVQPWVLAGALFEDDGEDFTRAELEVKVRAFLKRPVPTEEG